MTRDGHGAHPGTDAHGSSGHRQRRSRWRQHQRDQIALNEPDEDDELEDDDNADDDADLESE